MLCCPSCGSRFFKTLECRFGLLKQQIKALFYKKRCKRCKHKVLIELTAESGKARLAFTTPSQWQRAHRIDRNFITATCPIVSDYTLLISSDTSAIFGKLLHRK